MIVNVTEIIQSVTVEEIINDIDITIEESVSEIIVQQSGTQGPAGIDGVGAQNDHTLLSNIGINSHANIDSHIASTSNPHSVTKAQVGLGDADNTSDINKSISTATQTALDLKVNKNAAITGATKTKITYDAKGLVVSGVDATTADIIDGTNRRYVTDQNLTDINNTSGTNTGDQDLSGYLLKTTPSPTPVIVTADELTFVSSVGVMDFTGYDDVIFSSLGEYVIESDNDITLQSIGKTVIKNINGNDTLTAFSVKNTALSDVLTIDGLGNVVAGGVITGSNLSGVNTGDQTRQSLGISMTSLYSGGVVSGLGTATFSVTAGLGYIVSQTLVQLEQTSIAVNFNAVTAVTPLYARGVIYVNSAGAILQINVSINSLSQLFKKQNIILASYVVLGGVIASLPRLNSTPIGSPSKLEDLMEALGPLNLNGNIYSANGANLLLNKSSGETFQLKSNIANSLEVRDITTDAAGSPIANSTTAYAYRDGSGGFTLVAYTGVNPHLWDDGSGTPAAVTGTHFTIQRIYYFNRSGSTIIYLGQTQYNTIALADAAVGTEIRVVDSATDLGTLRCSLVIKHNTTDLTDNTKAVFFEASKFGASGSGSSSGTTTLQGAYSNSITPEIITNSTLGALTVKRGSAADTDFVLEGQNGAGTTTFSVTGSGVVVGSNLSGTNTGDQDISNLVIKNTAITPDVKTKITYDAKGLVLSGANATTADINDSSNKRYITDANLTVLNNTSNTNSGDQDLSGKASLTTTALSITVGGSWLYEYPFILVPANNTQRSDVVETYSGKWIENFTYTEVTTTLGARLTSLTFTDLEGVKGNFNPATLTAITSISLPALKVAGTFSPITLAALTTLSIPELRVVNGNFTPTVMGALTTLTMTNLRSVNGTCSPANLGALTTLSFPELESVAGGFSPNNMAALTTFSVPKLRYVGGTFSPNTINACTNISAPLLESVGNAFSVSGTALTTANFPLLTRCVGAWSLSGTLLTTANTNSLISVTANFSHNTTGMTTISYPALTSVVGVFSVSNNNTATSVSFPALTTVGSISCTPATNTTSFNLNALTTCLGSLVISYAKLTSFSPTVLNNITGALTLTGCNLLTTLNLSAMATYGGVITVTTIPVLTTVTIGTIGTLKRITGATVSFSACALTQASVDAILAILVSLNGTNGTTIFGSGKTVTLSGGTNSTPSAAGLANKAILVGRGAAVTNN